MNQWITGDDLNISSYTCGECRELCCWIFPLIARAPSGTKSTIRQLRLPERLLAFLTLSRARQVHFFQSIVKSRIATQTVPLGPDGKVHQCRIADGKSAIQLLECGIHFVRGT